MKFFRQLIQPAPVQAQVSLPPAADGEGPIADYHRDGVALMKGVLPQKVVARAQAAWKRLCVDIEEGRETRIKRAARFIHGGALPPELDEIPRHPALVDLARQVIGPDVALYMNRLLVKDRIWNGPVSNHQDIPYFHGTVDKLSIFVPLEPFTAETGNLKFYAGSHRYGNLGQRGTIQADGFAPMPVVQPDAYPGDVVLATFTVWHYSDAATIECDRPMLQIAYQAASDGAYFGEPDEPRLICGQWRTDAFSRFRDHIIPDA